MKSPTRNLVLAVATVTAGWASAPASAADICSEIAKFANSSHDHLVHRVVFTRDHQCDSRGYQPGEKLCQYLTSGSSPDTHIRQALSCLRDTDSERYDGRDAPYPVTVRYTSYAAEHTDRLTIVRIEYPADMKVRDSLTISAQKITAFKQPHSD